ncbi:putative disease resistance protein RGA4 [Vitis vinifera]|uniref:Putative disease resistance protein RGA4 n=1 Tax=Vitis vinifera TaxID=29760 RepID=A0A438BW03_VITVI|nr:putative disease resistance protein RGA4 [Vitis vinifera]
MAEQIPFSIAESLLTKLGSIALQEIGLVHGVHKELRKLENTLYTIKAVLVDAEKQQQEEKSRAVESWVRRLKDVVYDADDLLDDFAVQHLRPKNDMQRGIARQVSRLFTSKSQLAFRLKMGHRIKDIRLRFDEIANDISKFNFLPRPIIDVGVENRGRETHSFVLTSEIIGRDENKEDLVELLMPSGNEKIFPLSPLLAWGSTTNEVVGDLELDILKNQLHEKLNQKRYLLVLDDVWNDNFESWDQLRILLTVGAKGSKILVTTRSAKVASAMKIDSPYVLEGLREDQSWDLFEKLTFRGQEKVCQSLVTIGKEIIKMCKGVPLVIRSLGSTLQFKAEKSHWLSIRNNENLMSLDVGDNILRVLKLSYDNLPVHLRQCFAYCGLFPKDHKIERRVLVQIWIAQGYIHTSDERHHLEDIGDQYFEELLSKSFFQEVEKDSYGNILSCKMHDLIHDLAQSVAGSECSFLKNDMGNAIGRVLERARHVSLVEALNSLQEVLKTKHLRTIFVFSHQEFPCDLACRSLRVLDLSRLGIEKVPISVGKLNHLRYLDLSYNEFDVLPNSVTSFHHLQTLKLFKCEELKALPRDMRKLINLRHLEIDGCSSLTHMPSGLGELSMLQHLPLFVLGNDKVDSRYDETAGLTELKSLDHLRGELCIQSLENVRAVALESTEAILKGKQYLQSLRLNWWDLEANRSQDAELVMEGLQPHPNLKELYIYGYGGVRFPSWMMNNDLGLSLQNLARIEIRRCDRCQDLPPFGQLPSLELLKLQDLTAVVYINESSSATDPFFPSLKRLELYELPNLKGWWRRDGTEEQVLARALHEPETLILPPFPCLSKLDISDCPELRSFLLPSSPCLSKLDISECLNLTSLELHSCPRLSELHICGCPNLTSLQLPSFPSLEELNLDNVSQELLLQLMFVSSSLKSVSISRIDDLISLSSEGLRCLTSLSNLLINDCHSLMHLSQGIQHLTTLKGLRILQCRELDLSDKEDDDDTPFQGLRSLHHLHIQYIPKLVSLPKGLLQVTSLQSLTIGDCSGLATLPDWIGSLTSLKELQISDCPKLKSLPEEIRCLSTLQTLRISLCRHLLERCQMEIGEDWPKISHVPEIYINGQRQIAGYMDSCSSLSFKSTIRHTF